MGVDVSVGIWVGSGRVGVAVAFLRVNKPGKEHAELTRLNMRTDMKSHIKMRFFITGTIPEEKGGVK